MPSRLPAVGSLRMELNATSLQVVEPPHVTVVKFEIAVTSVCISVVVGSLNPEGHGLFIPPT
ncbi:MAG TPA: hypothetical protein VIK86_10130, partial [Candidatus Paceibacterota bacterium]